MAKKPENVPFGKYKSPERLPQAKNQDDARKAVPYGYGTKPTKAAK